MRSDRPIWSWIFPELRRFRSRAEMNEVLGKGEKALQKRLYYWMAAIAGIVPGMIVWNWGLLSFWYLDSIIGPVLTVAGPCVAIFWICGPRWRQHLRKELNARGIPICMKCGYDLTANESGVCPECGTELEKA